MTTAKKTTAKSAAAKRTTSRRATAKKPATPAAEPALPVPTGPEPVPSLGTDAAFAPPAPAPSGATRPLRNMSEVRHFFRTNDVPIYFVGATPFNLLGLDRWVRNFTYVSYYDAWDGAHPRVFTPQHKPYVEFESGEHINNWLLENPEVRAFIAGRQAKGVRPKIAMVFFDEETERICDELGYDLILPSAELRNHLDSKMVTTRLGNEVGVPSVPNVMATVEDFEGLTKAAEDAGLGADLVVQTAYGDSGKTTFFIASEADWKKHRKDIVGNEVKVMKRINNRPVAVEAVLTTSGTVVGPFMSELTGHTKLTPYRGGWCGNEMFPEVLTGDLRSAGGRPGAPARRPAGQGGLPRLLRGRRARRRRHRRGLPRRAEPPDQRRVVDHQRDGRARTPTYRSSSSTCWSTSTSSSSSTSTRSTSAGRSSPRSTCGHR